MWCDHCLLVLPLRAGAIAWAILVAAYSFGGGIFLLMRGQYLFFHYPEWQIYGGIGMGVGVCAVISMIALSNPLAAIVHLDPSGKLPMPLVIIIAAVRAIIMIVELQRGKDHIQWECDHGGQVWTTEAEAVATTASGSLPSAFCAAGFSSLNIAFIVSLLVDIVCQLYMFFLTWRFSKRLEHYSNMQGPFHGGYYYKA